MTKEEVLNELESYGDAQTKKTLTKHGAKEPFFGVKVADLKKIVKKTKKNHALSLELYETGNSDAMYLAGLIADEKQITADDLEKWVQDAYWYYISEFTVPWVAGETTFGFDLGLKWIESDQENVAAAGWATLASFAAVNPDENLNLETYKSLLKRVENTVHDSKNREGYAMNNFVIATGSYIKELSSLAKETALKIGKVEVNMNGTACKVPLASTYIEKVEKRGSVGKKRKTARC